MSTLNSIERSPDGGIRQAKVVLDNLLLCIQHVESSADNTEQWLELSAEMYKQVYSKREDKEYASFQQWTDRINSMINNGGCYTVYISDRVSGKLLTAALVHPSESIHYGDVLSVTAMVNVGGGKCTRILLQAYNFIGELTGIHSYVRYVYQSRGRYNLIYKELKWAE